MKQTAVEWLFSEICSEKLSWNKDCNGKLFIDLKTSEIFNRAKQMEKQQIILAFYSGSYKINHPKIYNIDGEDYYKETYETQND